MCRKSAGEVAAEGVVVIAVVAAAADVGLGLRACLALGLTCVVLGVLVVCTVGNVVAGSGAREPGVPVEDDDVECAVRRAVDAAGGEIAEIAAAAAAVAAAG